MPRPREETFVALLELAAGNASAEPVPQALYPLGRAPHLPAQVQDRARDVAKARLAEPGPARIFAVRTLGRTGEAAIGTLREAVAQADRYTANERVEAIRMLARNGGAGQAALRELLASLLPSTQDPIAATALVSPNFGVLLTLLSSLTEVGKSRAQIERFASLPVPAQAPESVRRRISWLRCTAAQLLAERDYAHPTLLQCDQTTDKSIGARAQVAALGIEGARIRGKRLAAWRGHATGGDLRAREAALALIADHPEIEDVETVLAEALAAPHPGVVATAAEVIAKHPERVRSSAPPTAKKKPAVASSEVTAHARVASALLGALDARGATADLEVLAAVIDASGALLLDGTRSKLEQLCRSPHVTVREHAGKALALLLGGGEAARCETPAAGLPLPAELASPVVGPIRIQLETDAGALGLALDPTFAPVAVGRIVGLARAGFYDGMVVHRVVPGFVSQLGSPTADGYGGAAGKPAMPCETSPLGFGPAAVGIALAGRDTGSSQLFVTHAAHPHLDGRYPLIGTASGPWDALVDGDRVRKTTVVP
jgi:cyclophilin family peptidyl-prolyl cis-trans isomerase